MFKITFDFTGYASPMSFMLHQPPVFDSIISYCIYNNRYRKKTDYCTCTGKELNYTKIEPHMPIEKWKNGGFYLASNMFYDSMIEYTDYWTKRWNRKHDDIAYFGKAKRRIHTGSGSFKSYKMPFVTMSIREAWFYFQGDVKKVEKLIGEHLYGIGKKVNEGAGWFSSFKIEEAPTKENARVFCRPVPKAFVQDNFNIITANSFKIKTAFGAYKPPYWLPENQGEVFLIENGEKT